MYADKIFPNRIGGQPDDFAGSDVTHIAITPMAAKAESRFYISHVVNEFIATEVAIPIQKITLKGEKTNPVTHHIADGNFLCCQRIIEAKIFYPFGNFIIK